MIFAVCLSAVSCQSPAGKKAAQPLLSAPAKTNAVATFQNRPASKLINNIAPDKSSKENNRATPLPAGGYQSNVSTGTADSPVVHHDKVADVGDSSVTGFSSNNSAVRPGGVQVERLPIGLPTMPAQMAGNNNFAAPLQFSVGQTQSNHLAAEMSAPPVLRLHINRFPVEYSAPEEASAEPLSADIKTSSQWRDRQLKRQEAESKAREAERDNLSRVFYRFLMGDKPAIDNNK